jgi:PEGA domain-containing protein
MSDANRRVTLRGIWFALIPILALTCRVTAQDLPRPTIIDSGEVKERRTQPVRLDRSQLGLTKASRPAFSVLIILTEPGNADVTINGKPAGRAINGRFKKELPSRKQYNIVVAAGADYEPYKRVVTLKPREPEVIEAPLTSRFGVIKVFPAIDGLKLLVDGQPVATEKLKIDQENRTISIQGLLPGDHKVTYDLPDYVIYTYKFKVLPGSEHEWNLIPQRAVTELTVVSDPDTVVFLDGEPVGKTPGDGILKRGEIRIGKHEVKLVKEDFEEFKKTLQFEFEKPALVEQRLTPVPTSAEFNENFSEFNVNRWTMPSSGWSASAGRLTLDNSAALAMPKNLHYRDFEMNFHLRLKNAAGAAWAVRVKDSKNYYLFYLKAARGSSPGQFITYVIRDGRFEPSDYASAVDVSLDLKADAQFDVHIKGTRNEIWHTITPAETGKPENLGYFKDPHSTFSYGGVGFRTVGAEKFSIDEIFVRPAP